MTPLSQSATSDQNLLSDLPSLARLSRRDQKRLANRLYSHATTAKNAGAITLAASLLRASYELEKV